jgi:hypothetical protein
MAQKKKTSKAAPVAQQMSPKKYMTSGRARLLPIYECWISGDWKSAGLCSIIIARKHTTGNVTIGIYLLDIFCLGLKNTSHRFNMPFDEYESFVPLIFDAHEQNQVKVEYILVHNLIYGGIAYAEDLGFKPERDWAVSQFVLAEDTEDIELLDLEFGVNGQPHFINGPFDNVQKTITQLEKSVGKGNFTMTYILGDIYDDDEDYDDDDGDGDDGDYDEDDIEDIEYEEIKS